jgi:hypothetical protein
MINNHLVPTTEEFMDVMKSFLIPTKRVRFSPTVCATAPGPLLFEEVKDLWYDRSELTAFKSRARKAVSESRKANDLSTTTTTTTTSLDLRGLEYCTDERQKHKFMAIRCIISASSRRGLQPDQLGSIARKCSAWNQQNAVLQGCHDYCNVYNPVMVKSIPQLDNTPPEFPIAMRKRKVTDPIPSQRRVRSRLSPISPILA